MSRTPTWSEVIKGAIDASLTDVHTCIPCTVTRYDASKQMVDVKPAIKISHEDEEGERQVSSIPVIVNCPIVYPGGGGLVMMFPIAVGDTGMIMFAESSMDKWLAHGGSDIDPGYDQRFHLSDGVYLPGVRPFSNARQTSPGAAVVIGTDGGAFQGAALGQTLQTFLGSLKTYLDAHTHTGVTTGGGTSGAPLPSPSVPDVTSDTVKITP